MTTCVLDVKLDEPKYHHTGDGPLVCGGTNACCDDNFAFSNCYNILTKTTFNLYNNNKRYRHTSWFTDVGLYLIGGSPSSTAGRTTELITGDSIQEGFPLKYDTRYSYKILSQLSSQKSKCAKVPEACLPGRSPPMSSPSKNILCQ